MTNRNLLGIIIIIIALAIGYNVRKADMTKAVIPSTIPVKSPASTANLFGLSTTNDPVIGQWCVPYPDGVEITLITAAGVDANGIPYVKNTEGQTIFILPSSYIILDK